MIPLRDTTQTRNYPVVNILIIVTNFLVYSIEVVHGEALSQFIYMYGLVPARYSVPAIGAHFTLGQQVFSFLSCMFLHGGFWHLLGNMWFLYIFGDNVEDRLGPIRYLLFYLLCGFASSLSHLFVNWHSQIPTIGASGAIAGVMGAYFVLYPGARVLTFIPIFFLPYLIEIPAFVYLGLWFIFQFISATGTPAQGAGVAWWAHIGGFVFGAIFLKIFLRIPELDLGSRARHRITKQKTHRLQVIKTVDSPENPDLYGSIVITPREARYGTKKLVKIPWGLQKRLVRVSVPSGSRQGMLLRLAGLGRQKGDGRRGDLYLKVKLQPNHEW
ncbi:MAG: rhomboid family intramembrane serine protease [Deltaproteobacteria bacterium]|nr:MAG: rhomboid family intramembrane serine protease [Deltaproteobacteria bacterium]